ncbi:zinc finger protein ZPR1-like [Apostichopus japonicus]|uniref:zinc finger protein ZPR1-like n=1 Tax=Stichopus japonicus TaxID=307972 RepID=UPI003AB32992
MTDQPYGNVPLFRDLSADRFEDQEATELESMCMNCHEDGTTRLLLTKIPFFKDVIISSFDCPHCGYKNNEVQPGGAIQDKGIKYTVEIKTEKDMSRQVVKSDSASVVFPELDFEIPANSQKGVFTTIEGLISRAVEGLEQDQPLRRIQHPEMATKIDEFIQKLSSLKPPFTVVLDDPTGNSFIENPVAPAVDPAMTVLTYKRTPELDQQLGIVPSTYEEPSGAAGSNQSNAGDRQDAEQTEGAAVSKDEVLTFQVNCSNCNSPTESRMKVVDIPFFKEIILMSLNCEHCGCKSNEVKSGSGVEPKGKKITLRITDPSDLNRDILKSETCGFRIPELEFEYYMSSDAGKFTTVEGMITSIKENFNLGQPFTSGDSAREDRKRKVNEFTDKLDQILASKMQVTIILDDPAGNSYLQNLYAPEPDPEMTIEEYERTEEQNEELGLNDMRTENY